MFGFGKKKETPPARANRARKSEDFEERKAQNRAQLGFLVGLDDDGGGGGGPGGGSLDIDDGDLEDELLMLLNDGESPSKSKAKARPVAPPRKSGNGKGAISGGGGLDNINFNVDTDDDGNDEDDHDLDDPDLQAELGEILGDFSAITTSSSAKTPESEGTESEEESPTAAPPSMSREELLKMLSERLDLYEKAKASSDKVGDSGKARRFTRGVKTLKEMLGKAKTGKVIDEADIPPIVSLVIAAKPSVDPSIVPTTTGGGEPSDETLENTKPSSDSPLADDTPTSIPSLPEPIKPVVVNPPQSSLPDPEPPIDYDPPTAEPVPVAISNPEVEERIKVYKKVAVLAKRNQDTQTALQYLKLSKALEAAAASGYPVDLTQFPEVPSGSFAETEHTIPQSGPTSITEPPTRPLTTETNQSTADPSAEENAVSPPSDDIFGAPPPPSTILEALEQRLAKYEAEVEKANSSSNSSKARRMGRIVKQYQEAIVLYKKGKPVPYEDLPTPPGFSPIPIPGTAVASSSQPANPNPIASPQPIQLDVQPDPNSDNSSISPQKKPKPETSTGVTPSPPTASGSLINRAGKQVSKLTLQEKQLTLITERQNQFRAAAVEAKKRGDINQAREYLRVSKGFDKLIEASKMGLPCDIATLPAAPDMLAYLEAEDFEVVTEGDCLVPSGKLSEVYTKLEEDLKQQLKMCMRTRDHFKSLGDVPSANRFESMALDTKKDLDAVRIAAKGGNALPKYHYENRVFSITECNTDLKEDEIEISVVQGVNYKGSSTIDTFVRVELPYPSAEEGQSQKSHVVKDSTDPPYNVSYKMSINRSARNFQRFVHRHGVKLEVWTKGGLCSGGLFFCGCRSGFLRTSTLFGTATVKLQPLETTCDLHDAFDILDGRKVVGKLEVKIRLRDPVLAKKIVQRKEKWLSIDRV